VTTLETPVPLLQNHAEFEQLLDLYRELEPERTLEVGTYHGGTLYHLLRNAPAGGTVVSVDSYSAGVDNRHRYSEWRPDDVSLHVIDGDSHDPAVVAQAADHGPYAFVFIDAGHDYDEVRADWANYGPLATGVVAFHDILAAHTGVPRLWAELKRELRTSEIIAAHEPGRPEWGLEPDTPWGGIGLVYP
jgi:cephalosporin hydroxylase